MTEWINADDQSVDLPEGVVVAFYPNGPEMGSGSAQIAWRNEAGGFNCEWAGEAKPSHFFYMPKEPYSPGPLSALYASHGK